MSNDDARLHGHGGGVEEDAEGYLDLLVGDNHDPQLRRFAKKCVVMGMKHHLASNPSPEPEDAEVEAAIAVIDSWTQEPDHPVAILLAAYQRLRSQAGQGRVVTPAQMKAIVEKRGIVADDGSLTFDGEAMAADVNALLAAQEKAK